MMNVRFPCFDEPARVTAYGQERIEIHAEAAAAPGTPLRGTLEDGEALELKVHRCQRVEDGFCIRGRCMNLRRSVRLRLEALFAEG